MHSFMDEFEYLTNKFYINKLIKVLRYFKFETNLILTSSLYFEFQDTKP